MFASTSASALDQRRWLKRLCEVQFFERNNTRCNIHPNSDKTRFCITCVDGPICPACVSDSHADHQVLQVYKINNRAVVQVSDMESRGVDLDYIQYYRNLLREVIHLNERTNKKPNPDSPKCERCEADLKGSRMKFCSITCKFNLRHGDDGQGMRHEDDGLGVVYSPRRHSRKGVPIRSPLH